MAQGSQRMQSITNSFQSVNGITDRRSFALYAGRNHDTPHFGRMSPINRMSHSSERIWEIFRKVTHSCEACCTACVLAMHDQTSGVSLIEECLTALKNCL